MTNPEKLTIKQAQKNQPWTVPYSDGVMSAAGLDGVLGTYVPHILGSHCALHAMKSIGKIAAVYEKRDHGVRADVPGELLGPNAEHKRVIRAMAADLMTAALRFANLEGFDLAEALVERVLEKNGADFGPTAEPQPIGERAHNVGCSCRGCR